MSATRFYYECCRQVARDFRNSRDCSPGGVVVLYTEGTIRAAGWMNELRDPQSWVAGCIAVDDQGVLFQAVGGDDYNGADKWVPIDTGEEAPEA